MAIRIVDNKKVDMTDDEYQMYLKIVKSYTIPPNNGEDYFQDLFETDNNGIILFLRPPSKRQTSYEIIMFLMFLMQNQHIRNMYSVIDDLAKQVKNKLTEIDQKLNQQ